VTYFGIGKINAAYAVTKLILEEKPKHIINLGTAGSRKYPWGTVVECSSVIQRDIDLSPLGFPAGTTPFDEISSDISLATYLSESPNGVCGTGDNFETKDCKLDSDLVDMEGYAIAKVCKKLGVGCSLIKFISDGSNETAHTDWQESLVHGAPLLIETYKKLLTQLA
jgi:adenosylhomocysteine nucleosidase